MARPRTDTGGDVLAGINCVIILISRAKQDAEVQNLPQACDIWSSPRANCHEGKLLTGCNDVTPKPNFGCGLVTKDLMFSNVLWGRKMTRQQPVSSSESTGRITEISWYMMILFWAPLMLISVTEQKVSPNLFCLLMINFSFKACLHLKMPPAGSSFYNNGRILISILLHKVNILCLYLRTSSGFWDIFLSKLWID